LEGNRINLHEIGKMAQTKHKVFSCWYAFRTILGQPQPTKV